METMETEKDNTDNVNIDEKFNVLFEENTRIIFGKRVKECDENSLFNLVVSNFAILFLDLEEVKKFITYLRNNKAEMLIDEMLKDFNSVIKDFRKF